MNRVLKIVFAGVLLGTVVSSGAMAADNVLVFGGTGRLGSVVVRTLAEAGYAPTVFMRKSSNAERLAGVKFERVEGDVLQAADVAAAMKTHKYVAVVDALAKARSEDASFYEVAARNIAVAAKASGVGLIVNHGSIGAGDSEAIIPRNRLPEVMRPVMVTKTNAEGIFAASGVAYTVLRNGTLLEDNPNEPEHAKLLEAHDVSGPVSHKGLARLTVECIKTRKCDNKIFHAIDNTLTVPPSRNVLLPEPKP